MFHGENHRGVNAKNETTEKRRYNNKTEQNTTDICQRRHHSFFALSPFIQKS
jgi:hypothetical protein